MNAIKNWWRGAPTWQKLLSGCVACIWIGGLLISLDCKGGLLFSTLCTAIVLGFAALMNAVSHS
ncbi:hypothetical protein N5B55_04770 [Ralstonia pickettii]|uniref:hypothetical protein n=1 Tax=Ralstonia pickettii TaxID=329 RepID=UPI0027144CC9|nr:hypothetical protein [Ralstonia pickettii]WKZ86266.1 hypothetical protein N5B55_04770 [Ralstonia pickettii]